MVDVVQMPLKRVEMARPEAAVGLEPGVDLGEPVGPQRVHAPLRLGPHDDQPCFPQHPQVPRHRRLRELRQSRHELTRRALAGDQEIQQHPSVRLGDRGEDVHDAIIPLAVYNVTAIHGACAFAPAASRPGYWRAMQPPAEAAPTETLRARLAELAVLAEGWTRAALEGAIQPPADAFGGMLAYHLGWRDADLSNAEQPAPSGKKLRSGLALLVSEAVCGRIEPARDIAVAVELVHNFSLVHDDIQDHSELRRHRATVWRLWGAAQAINVGDALFALAQLVLARSGSPRAAELAAVLNEACLRLVEGQFLDLELQAGRLPLTLLGYEAMIGRKTGALFEACCRLGAIVAGADAAVQDGYARYGLELGIAFQEQDDVLGVWGTAAETGKPRAADVRERKKGLPAVLALTRPDAPGWLTDAYLPGAAEMEPELVGRVIDHFETLALRQAVERRVAGCYERALEALCAAGGREPAFSQLAAVRDLLTARRA